MSRPPPLSFLYVTSRFESQLDEARNESSFHWNASKSTRRSINSGVVLLIIITGDNKRFERGEAMFIALRGAGGPLSIADRDDERMVRVARENNGSSAVARL